MRTGHWYYTQNGQPAAKPITLEELQALAAQGQLQPGDLVWQQGWAEWMSALSVPDLCLSPGEGVHAPQPPRQSAIAAGLPPVQPPLEKAVPQARIPVLRPADNDVPYSADEFLALDLPRPRRRGRRVIAYGTSGLGIALVIGCLVVWLVLGVGGWLTTNGSKLWNWEGRAVVRLNDDVLRGNTRLVAATTEFGVALAPARQGRPLDAGLVRAHFEQFKRALKQTRREANTLSVPSGATASALAEAYQAYVEVEAKWVTEFERVVAIVENPGLSDAQKGQRIQQILVHSPLLPEEGVALQRLQEALRNVAVEYKIPFRPVGRASLAEGF